VGQWKWGEAGRNGAGLQRGWEKGQAEETSILDRRGADGKEKKTELVVCRVWSENRENWGQTLRKEQNKGAG